MTRPISLTGIKPTGTPHLGNLVGAIRPALGLAERYDAYYFIADEHALTTIRDAEEMRRYSFEVTATWLACGLDPERTVVYKQSAVPEVFELHWIISCLTANGLMNRAHAYKAVSWIQSVTSPARPRNRTCSAAACATAFPLVRCHSNRVNSQNVLPPTPKAAEVVVAAAGGSSERLATGANGRPHTCLPRESTRRTRIGPSSSPAALVATSLLARSV